MTSSKMLKVYSLGIRGASSCGPGHCARDQAGLLRAEGQKEEEVYRTASGAGR